MSDIEKVVIRTRRLEKLLRQQYHASGANMDQLISSCEERLPHDVIDKLRSVAATRDSLVNDENDIDLDNPGQFLKLCDECEKELTPRSGRFIWGVALSLMVLITLAALSFYYAHWQELSKHL
ncbi:conserved hypothetical protein [Vibrio nigripulchritudo MADA3029]|uniref:DUF4145 domain-containing protein n=2 Tax=Vibrio nigripulchritudo TaxID=28173 RepID=U4KHN6_9VIBR|nr:MULTISPECIES: hypothetical protein [Vibrio]EGU56767.1 hypothetical protein VINI7043_10466 [Vibrio nigripulchritudo ATCC 27043]KJY67280.1 hypothetical protein TW74_27215 [Vibrio nigripulchritudo]UAB70461.1 DUF4145 domain-containing protein [Vibrio sp. SCSIO 43132]CCN35303.1 conserved hypothetical protein [Vibrio nigripulchritudo AM115]CCN42720.1 conserved hypothetical protein [Vibrio nigripulchritudo FTn2]